MIHFFLIIGENIVQIRETGQGYEIIPRLPGSTVCQLKDIGNFGSISGNICHPTFKASAWQYLYLPGTADGVKVW